MVDAEIEQLQTANLKTTEMSRRGVVSTPVYRVVR